MAPPDLQQELRDFMTETKRSLRDLREEMHSSLSKINEGLSDLREHTVKQNGNIALVMDRERATHKMTEDACGKVDAALDGLSRLEGKINLVRQFSEVQQVNAKERQADVKDEVEWLRDNLWKLLLGGVSLLTIGQKLIDFFQSMNTP